MQRKKHNHTAGYTRGVRLLAFLLSAILFLLPFSALPVMAEGEPVAQATEPLRFKLEWVDAVFDPTGKIAKATSDRRVRVTAVGDPSLEGTVVVSTFDISARLSIGEYSSVFYTYTMKGGQTREFDVGLGSQKNVRTGQADRLTSVNGTVYARQFGVRIVSVSEGATYDQTNILRGFVASSGGTFSVTRNTKSAAGSGDTTPYYNNQTLSANPGYMATGYSYRSASTVFEDTAYTYSGGGVLDPPPTVKVDNGGWFHFKFDVKSKVENNVDTAILMDYFPNSVKLYYSGTMRISDYRPVIATDGYSFEVYEGTSRRYYNGVAGDRNWDNNYSPWFDTGNKYYNYSDKYTANIASLSRVNTHYIQHLGQSDTISFSTKNWAGYDKQYDQITMRTTLADDTSPVVESFYISPCLRAGTESISYKEGDELYLAVRFSKPVQVERYDTGIYKFGIAAYVGNDPNDEIYFEYFDGSYTDTLIFKATISATSSIGQRQDLSGQTLTVAGFRYASTPYVRVTDMLVNRLNLNNSVNPEDKNSIPIPDRVSKTMECLIDTRIPKLQISEPSQSPSQTHAPTVTVTNTDTEGTLEYVWSTEADIAKVTEAFSDYTLLNKNGYTVGTPNSLLGSGMTGYYYLHVKMTSANGIVVTKSSSGAFLFDNQAPSLSQPNGQDYGLYRKEHTIRIEVNDTYSDVSKIWLYIKGPDGEPIKNGDGFGVYDGAQVYGTEEPPAEPADPGAPQPPRPKTMTKTSREEGGVTIDTYSLRLLDTDILLPENSFGAYTFSCVAEDNLGNRSEPLTVKQPLMYDNRDSFGAVIKTDGGAEEKPADVSLQGLSIYYNKAPLGEGYAVHIYSDAFGAEDTYTLYSVSYEGRTVYEGGAWLNEKTYTDYGFSIDPALSADPAEPLLWSIKNEAGVLHARLSFLAAAAGQYEVVYQHNGNKQSRVISFYLTPENATPDNYTDLYDDERLLVNEVYPFVIKYFYKSVGSVGNTVARLIPYDSGAASPKEPIFSSRTAAYRYALFMEYQDIEPLYLGTDSKSLSYIDSLNSGRDLNLHKANGEGTVAEPGQIWLRYKSIDWKPTGTQAEASPTAWVYYYYGKFTSETEKIDLTRVTTNKYLFQALENNAAEISGARVPAVAGIPATGTTPAVPARPAVSELPAAYLTKDNSAVDKYGMPTYSKTAVFYRAIVLLPEETVFSDSLVYEGDSGIYDSKIDYKISEGHVKTGLPLVSDYIFSASGLYDRVYIRPSGGGAYKDVLDGENLRDTVDGSGVYEIAEVGGGYRVYEIYVDVDAPLVAYYSDKGSGYLSDDMSGGDFLSRWLTLRYVVDTAPAHAAVGRPVEYDEYSYLYLESGKVTVTVEDFLTVERLHGDYETAIPDGNYTAEELEALQKTAGYRIDPGVYTLYVCDRLGNSTTLTVRTNDTDIFPVTKTPEVDDIEVYEPKVRPDVDITFPINRSAEEVISYEVRVNGEVIDTEYGESKTYVRSGSYIVTVRDIYGNTEAVSYKFVRKPPVVEFSYKNPTGNGYTKLEPIESAEDGEPPSFTDSVPAVLEKMPKGDVDLVNLSETYFISTSVDIRITYDASSKYEYRVTPESAAVLATDTDDPQKKRIVIPATDKMWKIEIYHVNDPETKILASCVKDVSAPEISAEAETPIYLYNEEQKENGEFVKNVLFRKDEVNTGRLSISDGTSLGAGSITFSFKDETEVSLAYYTLNGGEPVFVPKDKMTAEVTESGQLIYNAIVTDPGTYVFTAVDILGNASSFTATIDNELDFSAEANGKTIPYQTNPLLFTGGSLSTATYSDTAYIGQELGLTLREDIMLTFLWSNGQQEHIFQIVYSNRTISFQEMLYDSQEDMVSIDHDLAEAPSGLLAARESYGIAIRYREQSYDKEGALVTPEEEAAAPSRVVRREAVLVFEAPYLAYELLQMRFSTPEGHNPYILQVERSTQAPSLRLEKPDGSVIALPEEGFVGVNVDLKLSGDTSGLLSVYGYSSESYIEDYLTVPAENVLELYQNGALGKLSGDGYYIVVAKNKYGNEQVMKIRISLGLNIDIMLSYAEAAGRSFTVNASGEYKFYTNKSAILRVWDDEMLISALKDGVVYNFAVYEGDGYREIPLQAVGEYVIIMRDECENSFRFLVSITAPSELEYADFLSGFNENALRADENYTNAPLSIAGEACQAGGVQYVAFRPVGDGAFTVLADAISEVKLGYSPDRFVDSIGKEDGSYEVIFTDIYGNLARTYVHVSRKPQIFITRRTQSGKDFTAITLDDAMREGAWSNYILRLQNTAGEYRLTVDGALTQFDADGIFECVIPQSQGEASSESSIVYIDEYGNKYAFVIHLFRKVPVITEAAEGPIFSSGGEMYIKGDVSYTWTDDTVTATSLRDSKELRPYANGEKIQTDGKYLLTFTDIAGNSTTVRVARDTQVSCELSFGGSAVSNGVTVDGTVRIRESGEKITVVSATRNGEAYPTDSLQFSEHGSYKVTVADAIGNQAELYFTVYTHPVQSLVYTASGNYVISQLLLDTGTGKLSLIADVTKDPTTGKDRYSFFGDGKYEMTLYESETHETVTVDIYIDNAPPTATLVGVAAGASTRSDVTLDALLHDETIEVYKNGVLHAVYDLAAGQSAPTISDAGSYKIVIRDEAGNETAYEFIREFTTNAATNVAICLVLIFVSVCGILYVRSRARVRSK